MVHVLNNYGIKVTIFDPLANTEEVMHEYGLECQNELDLTATSLRSAEGARSNSANKPPKFDAIVLGVAHKQFLNLNLNPLKKELAVVYDVKGVLEMSDMKL